MVWPSRNPAEGKDNVPGEWKFLSNELESCNLDKLTSSWSIFEGSLQFSVQLIISSVDKDIFTYLICMLFFFFPFTALLHRLVLLIQCYLQMMTSGHPCLFPNYFTLRNVRYLIKLKKFIPLLICWKFLSWMNVEFSQDFSVYFILSVDRVNYINWFLSVKPNLHSWEPQLVMVYYPFNIILDLFFVFVKNFYIFTFFGRCWSLVFFFVVFLPGSLSQ